MSLCLPDDVISFAVSRLLFSRKTITFLAMTSKHIREVIEKASERVDVLHDVVFSVWINAEEMLTDEPFVIRYILEPYHRDDTSQMQVLELKNVDQTQVDFTLTLPEAMTSSKVHGTFNDPADFGFLMLSFFDVVCVETLYDWKSLLHELFSSTSVPIDPFRTKLILQHVRAENEKFRSVFLVEVPQVLRVVQSPRDIIRAVKYIWPRAYAYSRNQDASGFPITVKFDLLPGVDNPPFDSIKLKIKFMDATHATWTLSSFAFRVGDYFLGHLEGAFDDFGEFISFMRYFEIFNHKIADRFQRILDDLFGGTPPLVGQQEMMQILQHLRNWRA
jgi:hypothetical protein